MLIWLIQGQKQKEKIIYHNDENMKLVLKDEKIGKNRYGIGGVPFFIFPNDEVIEGAAKPESFINALKQVAESLD